MNNLYFNYIPNKKVNANEKHFKMWYKNYEKDLENLFSIFCENITMFDIEVTNSLFRDFVFFVYETSSRHI
jgi:hypothetical protein